ncbi:HNH endonuclease [Gammaproteobacteria bacterium]|nr:HNH endonuclease [Gammaproteobacteria bacterium]
MMLSLSDTAVRKAAFDWLQDQVNIRGDVLLRAILQEGFVLGDERIRLVGPQGIFKPKVLDVPLSIATVPTSPYDDGFSPGGLLQYRYRGTDPGHRDNKGLRYAMEHNIPLVYFHRIVEGKYLVVWPVFIVKDDPGKLTFEVAVDDAQYSGIDIEVNTGALRVSDVATGYRRSYITATIQQRVHQRSFRERVLKAYRTQCALCKLRHEELLDAAHIIPDGEPGGEPVVRNGLALCKLHHAAYDRYFVGITPDYVIEVRRDILEESDGPMLQHGLKELHGQKIFLPNPLAVRPSRERLENRYHRFLSC